MKPRLDTVIVFTDRPLPEAAAFYQEVLGFPELEAFGDRHVGAGVGDIYFGIDRVDEKLLSGSRVSLWFDVDDLHATFASALNAGATVRSEPALAPMGEVLASFFDPDGNIVGLVERS